MLKRNKMKNIFNKLRNKTAATVGALLVCASSLIGQVSGDVKYLQPIEGKGAYSEVNAFYGLPFGARGYTFMDFNEGNYYGKTFVTKALGEKGLALKTETMHANETMTQTGAGVQFNLPAIPNVNYANLNYLPAFVGKDGKVVRDDKGIMKSALGYAASVNLPGEVELSSFGQVVIGDKAKWSYGEVEARKNITKSGKVFIAGNIALLSNPTKPLSPKTQARATIGVRF